MTSTPPRYVLLIESNTSGTGADFVSRSRALGLTPILVTVDSTKYSSIGFPEVQVVEVEKTSPDVILSTLVDHGIDQTTVVGVTSSSDAGAFAAAALARRMGLPGPDPAAVETARDKYAARRALADTTLNPCFADAGEVDWAESLRRCPDGLVAKPQRGTGSMEVSIIRAPEDLPASVPSPGQMLLEERVPGAEYSAEFLGSICLGVCLKRTNGLGIELGHEFPASDDEDLLHQLTRAATQAMSALELDGCAAHVELIRDVRTGHIKVIEINPRLAGGRIPDLVRLATNCDPIIETIRLATEPGYRSADIKPLRGAAIEFMVRQVDGAPRPGGLEQAWNSVGVVDLEVYPHRLQELGTPVNGDFRDRIGHVICVGSTGVLASRHVGEAVHRVTWGSSTAVTEDVPGGTTLVDWTREHHKRPVGLVRGTESSHEFLSHRLQATEHLAEEVIDGREVSGRPRTIKALRNRFAQRYHSTRRVLMRTASIRTKEFFVYDKLSRPSNQRVFANLALAPDYALPSEPRLDYIVFKGCGVVPKRLLDHARPPVLNIHGGWLPNYRGNHCYFYAYYHEAAERDLELLVGSTLHEVTPKVDDGTILDYSRTPAATARSVEHAYCLGELISFERFIRSLHFPSTRRFARNAQVPDDVRRHQPKEPSRLYLTKNRTPAEEVKLSLRKLGIPFIKRLAAKSKER